jgi:hypothetical protein
MMLPEPADVGVTMIGYGLEDGGMMTCAGVAVKPTYVRLTVAAVVIGDGVKVRGIVNGVPTV